MGFIGPMVLYTEYKDLLGLNLVWGTGRTMTRKAVLEPGIIIL